MIRCGNSRWFTGAAAMLAVAGVALDMVLAQRCRTESARLTSQERVAEEILSRDPSPTSENLGAVAGWLKAERAHWATELARWPARTTASGTATPADLYFQISALTAAWREAARWQGVVLKAGERFGFAEFAQRGPERSELEAVARQLRAVDCLLTALFASKPQSLVRLQRERLEPKSAGKEATRGIGGGKTDDFFDTGRSRSLDTLTMLEATGLRVEFTGHTESLRQFLGRLAESGNAVIVRQLEIEPAGEEQGRAKNEAKTEEILVRPEPLRFVVTAIFLERKSGETGVG